MSISNGSRSFVWGLLQKILKSAGQLESALRVTGVVSFSAHYNTIAPPRTSRGN